MSQPQRYLLLTIPTQYLLVPIEHSQAMMGFLPDCVVATQRYGDNYKYIYSPADHQPEVKMLAPGDIENTDDKLRADLKSVQKSNSEEYSKRRELENKAKDDSARLAAIEDKNRELGSLCTSLLERIAQQGEALTSKDVQLGVLNNALWAAKEPTSTINREIIHGMADTPAPIEGADVALVQDWVSPDLTINDGDAVTEVTILGAGPDILVGQVAFPGGDVKDTAIDLAEPSAGDHDEATLIIPPANFHPGYAVPSDLAPGKTGSIKDLDNENPLI